MKKIYLLIGLKGSGKSFIGTLFQEEFDIPFVRVEDWAKAIKKSRNVTDDNYIREVFETIERKIKVQLMSLDSIVFESTGLTPYFDKMIERLAQDYKVITVKILANEELCIKRVRTRDQSIHINVSDEELITINQEVSKKDLKTDYLLENFDSSVNDLKKGIHEIIHSS